MDYRLYAVQLTEPKERAGKWQYEVILNSGDRLHTPDLYYATEAEALAAGKIRARSHLAVNR